MDWPMYRRVERQAGRMHDMMARLGVDVRALVRHRQAETYAEARQACLACRESERCLQWLDFGPADRPPDFCRQLPLFLAFTPKG